MKSNSRFEVATEAALRRALVSGVIASVVLAGIIGLILIFTVGVLLGLVVGVVLFVGASAGWMLYVQSAFGDAASSVLEGGAAALARTSIRRSAMPWRESRYSPG
ncbi:MAG: hypothetical protein R2714_01365 [Microthrixaceae bacterium]